MESLQAGFCLLITLICNVEWRRVSTWKISFILNMKRITWQSIQVLGEWFPCSSMNPRTVAAINYISRTRMLVHRRPYLQRKTWACWLCTPLACFRKQHTLEIVSKYKANNFFCNTHVSQELGLPTFPLVFDFCTQSCRKLCCLNKNLIKKQVAFLPNLPKQLLLTSHIDPILQSFS